MDLSTPDWIETNRSGDDELVFTEFSLDGREPLRPTKFGSKRFMWGSVAFAIAFMTWMASSQ